MGTSFCGISNVQIKEILSRFFGDSKRIPLNSLTLTMTDEIATQIDAEWEINEDDVKDHIDGILQGVMMQEAASQAIICYVISMDLFPNHTPAFLGSNHFRLRAAVHAGEKLHIKITDLKWRGAVGSASVNISKGDQKAATIDKILFAAVSEKKASILARVA